MGVRADAQAVGGGAAHVTLTAVVRKRLRGGFELDVTVLLSPGITMLFGASGSGKTTLLRTVAGLLTPDGGSISIGTRVVYSAASGVNLRTEQRHIGYVFQQLALFPHLTIRQNVSYGLAHVAPADRANMVQTIAESFRITHILDRRPADTSGGERQRAALARSLVLNPSVLMLDEPLSALDHAAQSLIIDDLRRWNATHAIPILYVTHAHREVFALGERVLVMDRGRIVADGSPTSVLDAPESEPIALLAGFENVFTTRVVARSADSGTMTCRLPHGSELEVPLAADARDGHVRVAIRAGDILLANEEPKGLSARNVCAGTIGALRREGPTVVAEVHAGDRFVVHLTPGAVDSLHLVTGMRVWLVIKTYSCRIVL
jgi:molybdate transport system ATP-binding protein